MTTDPPGLDLTEAYQVAAATWRCHDDPELQHAHPDVQQAVSRYLLTHPKMRAMVAAVAAVVERQAYAAAANALRSVDVRSQLAKLWLDLNGDVTPRQTCHFLAGLLETPPAGTGADPAEVAEIKRRLDQAARPGG